VSFGGNVYRERITQGLTQEDLAKRAHISRSMLSKIERGQTAPTLPVADRLATALGCTIPMLLNHNQTLPAIISLISKDERAIVSYPNSSVSKEIVFSGNLHRGLEISHVSLPPHQTTGRAAHTHGTTEYIIVECGLLLLSFPNDTITLNSGDCILYKGDVSHELKNIGEEDAQLYVITAPGNGLNNP